MLRLKIEPKSEIEVGKRSGSLEPLAGSVVLFGGNTVSLIDTCSGKILNNFFPRINERSEDLQASCRFKYLRKNNRLVVAKDGQMKMLAPTAENTFLLGFQTHVDNDNVMFIELSLLQAVHLLQSIQSDVISKIDKKYSLDLISLEKQLHEALNISELSSSNKNLYWKSCRVSLPYSNLKSLLLALLDNLGSANYDALSVVQYILEVLHTLSPSPNDTEVSTQDNMFSEKARLQTFQDWPKSDNRLATPSNLARAGLYYQPVPSQANTSGVASSKIAGMDRTVCYKCKAAFSAWETLTSPWEEHLSQMPGCSFAQGRDMSNIPLAASLVGLPFKEHSTHQISKLVSSEEVDILAAISKSGQVSLWDTSIELTQVLSFTVLEERTGSELRAVAILPRIPQEIEVEEKRTDEKWSDWCTVDINVEVRGRGLYPGAKGVVFDILSDENCCVFLAVLNEMVSFPTDHLKPLQPKPKDKVKVLKGDDRGKTGVFISLQSSRGIVKMHGTKDIKMYDLSWLASMPNGTEQESIQTDGRNCCLLTAMAKDGGSLLSLYETKYPYVGLLQTFESRSSLLDVLYLSTMKKIVALYKGSDRYYFVVYNYDEKGCRLHASGEIFLKSVDDDQIVSLLCQRDQFLGEIVLVITESGNILAVDACRLQVVGETATSSRSLKVKEAVLLEGDQELCLWGSDNRLLVFSLNRHYPALYQEGVSLGPITLSNLQPLKQLDLNRLEFVSYPPLDIKQFQMREKGGTFPTWQIPGEWGSRTELRFELEMSGVRMIDRVDLSLGFLATSGDFSSTEVGGRYGISVISIDSHNSQKKMLDKLDLSPFIETSVEGSDTHPFYNQQMQHIRTVSLNIHLTASLVVVVLHLLSSEPEKANTLRTFGVCLCGVNSNSPASILYRNKLMTLLESPEYHLSLLETCQEANSSEELRNLCLDLLWIVWSSTREISHIIHSLKLDQFLSINVVFSGSRTARLAAQILLAAVQTSPGFRDNLLEAALNLLPTAIEASYSPAGLYQLFSLISSCWSSNPDAAFSKCVEMLQFTGQQLYEHRNPFYNILRTHYGLYGVPLEIELFQGKSMEDLKHALGGERLQMTFSDKSANATPDPKQFRVRFQRIQKTGNFVILDFGIQCLLNDVEIYWRTDNNTTPTLLQIDTWTSEPETSKPIIQKVEYHKSKKVEERPNVLLHNLSKICRYVKIHAKPVNPSSYEGATMTISTYGITDYVSPIQDPVTLIPILKSQIHETEERQHSLSVDFANKRRTLTTMLEEINMSGSDFARHKLEVVAAYEECTRAQLEYYKLSRKLRKLKEMKRDAAGERERVVSAVCGGNHIDRWMCAAEHLAAVLLRDSEQFQNGKFQPKRKPLRKTILQDLFRNFVVFGTPSLRTQIGNWLMHQLNDWVSFPSETLHLYFSTRSLPIGPLNLFPQQDVFRILQDIMAQERYHFAYVNHLFSLLDQLTHLDVSEKSSEVDLSLISWLLLLLSNAITLSSDAAVVHYGTKCSSCHVSPIHGVRYHCVNCVSYDLCENCEAKSEKHERLHLLLKISKPLPLYSASFQQYQNCIQWQGATLLPVLYKPDDPLHDFTTSDSKTIQHSVTCNGCGKVPITGVRYKCTNCDEFNFCDQCEGKVDHFPLHFFLKVKIPLPSSQLPKALIPTKVLIATLLHRPVALCSSTPLSLPQTPPFPSCERGKEEGSSDDDGVSFNGRPLRSIFSLLSSPQPLSREVMLLACRVLEGLANQFTSMDVMIDVFQHPQFSAFLDNIASYADAFLRNTVLHMLEVLCKGATYEDKGFSLPEAKELLRETACSLLIQRRTENSATFSLELLLIITTDKDSMTRNKRSVEELTSSLLNFLTSSAISRGVLQSSQWRAAREICMVFRLLQLSDPNLLFKSPMLLAVLRSVVTASSELQSLLQPDFTSLITMLLGHAQSRMLHSSILTILTETFGHANSSESPLLYITLVKTLTEKLDPTISFASTDVASLLHTISEAMPDFFRLNSIIRKRNGRSMLRLVLELVNAILAIPPMIPHQQNLLLIDCGENNGGGFSYRLLEWLSQSMESSAPSSPGPSSQANATKELSSLRDEVVKMIKILSSTEEGARHYLRLCLSVMKVSPSVVVAELCQKLISSRELAFYFCIDLGGYNFLFTQISLSSNTVPSFLEPVSAAIRSHMTASTKSFAKELKHNRDSIENLNAIAEVLGGDVQLAKLIKDGTAVASNSTSCIWTYQFKTAKRLAITIALSSDAVLKEIQMHAMQNYRISNSNSQFPPYVTVETGTSISRLVPCGRFQCQPNPNQPNQGTPYTSCFKFKVGSEVVRFVRLSLDCPDKSGWIALSRIQLRGYTLGSFHSGENTASQLPVATALELLSHCLKFSTVQEYLAHQEVTKSIAVSLLERLSVQTNAYIQDILLAFAKHNETLSFDLLSRVLVEGQTTYHAMLAGRLCSLVDNDTATRLCSLRDFVFTQLTNQQPPNLSSYLMPFLNALSFAISQQMDVLVTASDTEMRLLLEAAVESIDGSLMEEGSLKLLSSLIQADSQNYQVLLETVDFSAIEAILLSEDKTMRVLGILASSSPSAGNLLIASGVLEKITEKVRQFVQSPGKYEILQVDRMLETSLQFFCNVSHDPNVKSWIGENLLSSLFALCANTEFKPSVVRGSLNVLRTCCNLHATNKHMVATYLLEQVRDADTTPVAAQEKPSKINVSESMLQLMVEMFSFGDNVVVCLHTPNGAELTSTTVESAKLEPIKVDTGFCNSSLDIDETAKTVSASDRAKYVWRTAIGSRCMKAGVHKWDVIIEKTTSTCNIMVGVCEQHQQLTAYPGGADHNAHGWSYYGCAPGYVYHNSRNKEYGEPFRTGDVIGVVLDMDEGTLAFSKNGNDFGIAYTTGLSGKELYPSVSLYDVGDKVTFRDDTEDTHKCATPTLNAYSLELESPLRFQRPLPVLSCSLQTSLRDLELSVLGCVDKPEAVSFYLATKNEEPLLLDNATPLGALLEMQRQSGSFGEIIDMKMEVANVPGSHEPNVGQRGEVKEVSVFRTFAEREGLSKLASILYARLSDSDMVCKQWLIELTANLKIPGYPECFIRSPECCNLLFKVMKGEFIKGGEEGQTVRDPFNPLQSVLFELFGRECCEEEMTSLRKAAVSSGALEFVLIRLSSISGVEPRKAERFQSLIEMLNATHTKNTAASQARETRDSNKTYWAKGTGYGTNSDTNNTWNHVDYMKQQDIKAKQIDAILQGLLAFLGPDRVMALPEGLYSLLEASCVVPLLEGYLRNDSLLDMGRHIFLYITVLKVVRTLVSQESLILLIDTLSGQSSSIFDLMNNLNVMAEAILKRMGSKPATEREVTSEGKDNGKKDSPEDQIMLALEINNTSALVTKQINHYRKLIRSSKEGKQEMLNTEPGDSLVTLYQKELKPLQFGECTMVDEKGEYLHHYKGRIATENIVGAANKIKRLVQEVGTLSSGMPLNVASSVFLRVDEERIDVMRALITGPEATPYENGCFQFDVYCPPEYPDAPPVVNLQTTGGGSVRFNPNLYNCGKVCLSLLGTWSGGTNEKWNAKTSTLLQVLVSIQSLILVEQPYYNEPGYETQMGTPQGAQKSVEYNEVIRVATLKWAMIEQLRNPSPGLEDVIRLHFKLKRSVILKQVSSWLREAQSSKTSGYFLKLKKAVEELKQELHKLDPTPSDPPNTFSEC